MSAEILIDRGTTVQHRLCVQSEICILYTLIGVAFDNDEKTDPLLLENNDLINTK